MNQEFDQEEEESSTDILLALLEAAEPLELEQYLEELPRADAVWLLSSVDEEQRKSIVTLLKPELAAELLTDLPSAIFSGAIESLEAEDAAKIFQELPSDEQADLLANLERASVRQILAELPPEDAADARALASYPANTAGGLMITEYLAFPAGTLIREVVSDLSEHAEDYASYVIQYLYVVDERENLVGVVRLRDLLLSPKSNSLREIMLPQPQSVSVQADLEQMEEIFERYPFYGLPVVAADGALLGVLEQEAVRTALREREEVSNLRRQGIISGDELRSMPVLLRSRRRLSWLTINIGLNVLAASVIAMYQDTLSQVLALAVFLPIISDMSGCSGNQAVAVSMRELTLGVLKPFEVFKVWIQELKVGLINGLVLGGLLAGAAWLWKGSLMLSAVVGLALALNTLVAVSIGGAVPLLLKRLGYDPALASGPILTTVTDMMGFFLALSMAAACLPYL